MIAMKFDKRRNLGYPDHDNILFISENRNKEQITLYNKEIKELYEYLKQYSKIIEAIKD